MQTDSDKDTHEVYFDQFKALSAEEIIKLEEQNTRLVPPQKAIALERDSLRHWDLFYKRNERKFFKDRHWTTREFQELVKFDSEEKVIYLELGCGVGNTVFPLIEEGFSNFFFYACDFSPRAIELVKHHHLYDEARMLAFEADITTERVVQVVGAARCHVASLIFVLSSLSPARWAECARVALATLREGGRLLLRDYARHDHAQLRFARGHKIQEHFYMRQDGTRAYYFERDELISIFTAVGFEVISCSYVQRRTVNVKENLNVPRIFIQAKFKKPDRSDASLVTR